MRISEVFASIQGEGMLSGIPSLFIRTSGCNLRCRWCDTPYASWAPEGEDWTVDRIVDWVAQQPVYRHAVLTGGEPMIQPELPELARQLDALGLHITIETAGTVFADLACHLLSLSPKLANSIPPLESAGDWATRHDRLRVNEDVLLRLTRRYEYQLKFVVASPEDLGEIRALARLCQTVPDKVLLMPEARNTDELHERSVWLVDICKQTGYRFCPRLHVGLFGGRRGF
ncbi:MAG TPA: 7-carboxy-7-deazaguanine synthase QueE [Bryobacteraceae bacterium]|nr:7-carboxy-7-deazaguanine synthase QueE [Bryobacteraceae bacterium]